MSKLAEKKCIPCDGGTPRLKGKALTKLHKQLNRGWKVVPAVIDVAPVTLSLVTGAAILWVIGGVAIGLLAAATRGSILDRTLMMLGLIGVSMPVYWLGEVMNLITQSRMHDSWRAPRASGRTCSGIWSSVRVPGGRGEK